MAKDTIRISKLEAARRQLRTAITLWFTGGEPVAVHTLAFAAYEILHHLSEKRDPTRRDLLFDTATVKDEYRKEWNQLVRKEANFFKHADRDGDSIIEFNPQITEYFILFAIAARELCGEARTDEESIFSWWLRVNRSEMLSDKGSELLAKQMPIDSLKHIQATPKHDFFERCLKAFRTVSA
jgi:5-methylthioribose kinase